MQRILRLAPLVLVAGLALGCSGPAPSSTPAPSVSVPPASPSAPGVSPADGEEGDWPSTGPAPVADQTSGLYLSYQTWGDIGGAYELVVIFDDGLVVLNTRETDWTYGKLSLRHLAPAGLALVRNQVAAVGLFGKSQTRKVVHSPNCCGAGNQLSVVSGGQTISVGEATLPAGSYAASAQWDRFEKLVANLARLSDWIPAAGWADADWRPYHAPSYCLVLTRSIRSPSDIVIDGADVVWPAGVQPFDTYGESALPGADPDRRLGRIPATTAYSFADSIAETAGEAGVSAEGHYVVPLNQGGWMITPLIDVDAGNPLQIDLYPVSPGLVGCPLAP